MISFAVLSALARGIFALWGLLLCLTNIGSAVLAFVKKHYRFTAFAFILFAPAYFMWQIIFDFSLFGQTDKISVTANNLCSLPWACWLAAFVILTLADAVLFWLNVKYGKTSITPAAIKLYLDRVPCGICCWRENGRVLFSNICMNAPQLPIILCSTAIIFAMRWKAAYRRLTTRSGVLPAVKQNLTAKCFGK